MDLAGKGATITAAIVALAGAAAAGPALPVIIGIAAIAAAGAKIYAQNKKLARMFTQTSKLTAKIKVLLAGMIAVSVRKNLTLDVSDVQTAADDILDTIARIAGPDTIRQIQEDLRTGQAPNVNPNRWQRFKRAFTPGTAINNFREQLVNLSLAFSILQSEFALQLEKPENDGLVALTDSAAPAADPAQVAKILQGAEAAAAAPEDPTTSTPGTGGRTTRRRRHRGRRKTSKRM